MFQHRFLLSSEECELLLAFESCATIEKTARTIGKDPSGVSRQLSKIASCYPAIEKRQGKWVLTSIGKRLNSLTRDNILIQKQLIDDQVVLRIGTNREFGARIIGPNIQKIKELFPNTQLLIHTYEYGTENALLNGQIDIGLDCERPNDPDIAYKQILDEPIVAACTKRFYQKHKQRIASGQLNLCPHLLCERLYPDKLLSHKDNRLNIHAMFNDIATAKAACLTSSGWILTPRYSIEKELSNKKLVTIETTATTKIKYGVWWLRNRQLDKNTVQSFCDWMKTQKL